MAVGFVTAVVMVVLLGAARAEGLSVAEAVADPEEATGYRFLGVVSNLGLLLWASTAAVLVFAATAVDATSAEGREWRRFLLAVAGVATLLLVDDFLLVHEFGDDAVLSFVDFEATRGRKNVIETAVFATYGIAALGCGWRFRHLLRQLDRRPLLLAGLMLASSYLVDMRAHRLLGVRLPDGSDGPDLRSILEEGPKLAGIAYLVVFAAGAGRQAIGHAGARRDRGIRGTPSATGAG